MSGDKKIIVPGTDKPASMQKVLEALADQQRVATLIVRRGERFLLKIREVRTSVVVGEVRCLQWSPSMGKRIHQHAKEQSESINITGEQRKDILLADAIDQWGSEAHRYRVYIPIEEITAVYEDLDDRFDETPFLPLP
jgi:hypothetical protein